MLVGSWLLTKLLANERKENKDKVCGKLHGEDQLQCFYVGNPKVEITTNIHSRMVIF